MANKMLIDAAHPEETRVVVVRGNRVEEFDFEAANRKQLRGNIYLAKVTRVEPSLQAAFVEYGGNRHGFLAFSEIHPDYYQIPMADRQALLEAEASQAAQDSEPEAEEKPKRRRRTRAAKNETPEDVVSEEAPDAENDDTAAVSDSAGDSDDASVGGPDEDGAEATENSAEEQNLESSEADDAVDAKPRRSRSRRKKDEADAEADSDEEADSDDQVESVGAEDALEELPERRQPPRKQYKIQEVIKRRQVILVQVVKEERGNKGAALTTYLSLAGRYSVLMPNTARGGGISRKITQPTDRKRLKKIASELDVPEGMGVILRTAGASRTKAEIKRDFEYLMRLWENVRELTLKSSAPSLVYEEGSLIKRSIRDLYNKDIDEVSVAGDEGYREAKDFMRMLMPSHAKNVQPYRDPSPLFIRYGVEPQLDAMFSPQVTLKSGGYIVINQTEALVSIDVNSGKSTREHNIEDTALQTNLEAAEEVTRQLRLRDLAGLVVIDFIDMEENKNNRLVERKLKDCLKNDRARIQVGRISHFGLLEMSRQRLRTGVLESSTTPCPHCSGTGMIRSVESVALHVLRSLEDNLLKGASHNLLIRTTTTVALYILNQKRSNLFDLETRFAVEVEVQADDMVNGQLYVLERTSPIDREENPQPQAPIIQPHTIEIEDEPEPDVEAEGEQEASDDQSEDRDRKRRRRRKRRRGGNQDDRPEASARSDNATADDDGDSGDDDSDDATEKRETADGDDDRRRKRRRGRRGGRRGRRNENGDFDHEENGGQTASGETDAQDGGQQKPAEDSKEVAAETGADAPSEAAAASNGSDHSDSLLDTPAEPPAEASADTGAVIGSEEAGASQVDTSPAPQLNGAADHAGPADDDTKAGPEPDSAPSDNSDAEPEEVKPSAPKEPTVTSETSSETEDEKKPKRGGWWQRRSFF
ncbi:RNAse E [Roseibium hamelinense]|uniref:Ribonuclease E n=1 Tax=Roseibium hamelinense TaxID=150831 RepID=A0A562TGQ1_9HYPH|nr:ribonuclease E/G [Roseibium hamelinense]MTI46020.1 Rne/Rng family ribonuclease [Roseibium hamelinense]TWI92789.1 RNAse E [Roseibium hamelinense]